MRIIAGKYKGRLLLAPEGRTTRPVLSRVRKAIFDTAAPIIPGARVLDLFAGSGGFVIEALSRGAASAVAIDLDASAIRRIRENLANCAVVEPVTVYKNDAFDAIAKLGSRGARFDFIAVAPPYWKGLQARALTALDGAGLLEAEGAIFVQRDAKEHIELAQKLCTLRLVKRKEYGNTVVDWFELAGESSPASPPETGPPGAESGAPGAPPV